MTLEHVLPKRLKKVFLNASINMTYHRTHKDPSSGMIVSETSKRKTSPFDETVKMVCNRCNNGWLETIVESNASNYLDKMILGQDVLLDAYACEAVALWAAKTAAVRGLTDKPPHATSPKQFRHIMQTLSPNPHTYIWIGRSNSAKKTFTRNLKFAGRRTYVYMPQPEILHGHLTTIAIGHMVLYILACPSQDLLDGINSTIEELDRAPLIRIHPHKHAFNFNVVPEMAHSSVEYYSSLHDGSQHARTVLGIGL